MGVNLYFVTTKSGQMNVEPMIIMMMGGLEAHHNLRRVEAHDNNKNNYNNEKLY